MIYEANVAFRPGLLHVRLGDAAEPLPPRKRPKLVPPSPPPEATVEDLHLVAPPEPQVEKKPTPPPPAPREDSKLGELMEQMLEGIQELKAAQENRLEEMQRVAIEVAVAIASHVMYERLESGDYPLEELVREAVRRLEPRETVKVSLHPEDLALLEGRLTAEPKLAFDPGEVRLVADPRLARGDCRAEAGDVHVITHLEEHLAEIRRQLMSVLPDAGVERRKPVSEERALRRYPDRRHTA